MAIAVGEFPATAAAPAVAASVGVAPVAAAEVLAPPGSLGVGLPLPGLVVPVPSVAPSGHEHEIQAAEESERIAPAPGIPRPTLDPYQNLEKLRRDSDLGLGFGSDLGFERPRGSAASGRGGGGGGGRREDSGRRAMWDCGGWCGGANRMGVRKVTKDEQSGLLL